MGPITILDKSAFQGLSRSEHTLFHMWFLENVTPVLIFEIQGDLAKQGPQGSREKVRELARKFGGSGGVVNLDYVTAARQSLLGAAVPMTGQIVPHEATTHYNKEMGGWGFTVDLSPLNYAILRWAQGEVTPSDDATARLWREVTHSISFTDLQERLNRNHVVLPRPTTPSGVVTAADSVLREPGLEAVWLDWLLDQLSMTGRARQYVLATWGARPPFQTLKRFAPYAFHCLRCLIALSVAVRHRFLKWDPTHMIDVQYLYYLPFCQVFVSEDRVHKLLAPGLMRANQIFVRGVEFKRDLRRMQEARASLAADDPLKTEYKFGGFPRQPEGSIVQELWDRCHRAGGIGSEEDLQSEGAGPSS